MLLYLFNRLTDTTTMVAALRVTGHVVLALLAIAVCLMSIFGLTATFPVVDEQFSNLAGVVPAKEMALIFALAEWIAGLDRILLATAVLLCAGIVLWSAHAGLTTMIDAVSVVEGADQQRCFKGVTPGSIAIAFVMIACAFTVFGVVVLVPLVLDLYRLGDATEMQFRVASLALMSGVVAGSIFFFRRCSFGPAVERRRWLAPGLIAASLTIIILSVLYSWAVSVLVDNRSAYWPIGILAGLVWVWTSLALAISGAAIEEEKLRKG